VLRCRCNRRGQRRDARGWRHACAGCGRGCVSLTVPWADASSRPYSVGVTTDAGFGARGVPDSPVLRIYRRIIARPGERSTDSPCVRNSVQCHERVARSTHGACECRGELPGSRVGTSGRTCGGAIEPAPPPHEGGARSRAQGIADQFFSLSATPCAASVSRTPCWVPCRRSTTPFSFFMITSLGPPATAMPASPAA